MERSENFQLTYLAARIGLGLNLMYSGAMVLVYTRSTGEFPGVKIDLQSSSNSFMTVMALVAVIKIVVGILLLLDQKVRLLAILVAIFSIATSSMLPAVVALGLVAFWSYNISMLKQGEEQTETE